MKAAARGACVKARKGLMTPPPKGQAAANKNDGKRLEQLRARVEGILRRVPDEAFAVIEPIPVVEDTLDGRRALAWQGLVILGAVARGLQTQRIGHHGNGDRHGPAAARAAYELMINFDRQPTSGSRNSTFRRIAGLLYAVLKHLPVKGDDVEIPDLERACEAVLADVKVHGDVPFRWDGWAAGWPLVQKQPSK